MQLVMNLSIIAILWVGGYKVMDGQLQIGELISFVNYLVQVLMSLMLLSMFVMTTARASASSRRVGEVLDTTPSLADTANNTQLNEERHNRTKGRTNHCSTNTGPALSVVLGQTVCGTLRRSRFQIVKVSGLLLSNLTGALSYDSVLPW
ncbi:MAG: hypothetical protein V8S95_13170 [Odoribacter sp.]